MNNNINKNNLGQTEKQQKHLGKNGKKNNFNRQIN